MSEDGDMWRAIREEGRNKRWENVKSSIALLTDKGIKYECLSENTQHYRVGDFDFWPSTGRFIHRKSKKKGRGVFNLLRLLTNEESV